MPRGRPALRVLRHGALLALGLWAAAPRLDADPVRRSVGPGQWLRRLSSADPSERAGAAWLLGRYASISERPELVQGLGEMLSRESDPGAMMAAIGALAAGDEPRREDALRGLFGDARVASTTLPTEVAASAVRARGQWTDEQNLRGLLRLARAAPSGAPRADLTEAVALALSDLPEGAFTSVMAITRGSIPERAVAVRAAGLRGDPTWARVIAEQLALTVAPLSTTLTAVEATVRLRLTEHAPALIEIARGGRERGARRAATRALGALGGGFDPSVLRGLMGDPVTREAAFESAGALGDPQLVGELSHWLDAPWEGDRRAAAEALGALGGELAASALSAPRAEGSEAVRDVVWHALSRCGAAAVARLSTAPDTRGAHWARVELALREGLRPAAGSATGDGAAAMRLRALRGEPVALEGLASASADLRAATAMALGDAREGGDALSARLRVEDDEGVRVAIVIALGALGDRAAREALGELVARESSEASVAAGAAATALGELGEFSAAMALRGMTRARTSEARAAARWALGVLHDPGAIGLLELQGVTEADTQARGAALVALARLWGDSAVPSLRWAARTAGSERMDAMVDYAERIVRGGGRAVFSGRAVVRVHGAAPRSVWALDLPDGGLRFGVAAEDGVVLIDRAPSDESTVRRVW